MKLLSSQITLITSSTELKKTRHRPTIVPARVTPTCASHQAEANLVVTSLRANQEPPSLWDHPKRGKVKTLKNWWIPTKIHSKSHPFTLIKLSKRSRCSIQLMARAQISHLVDQMNVTLTIWGHQRKKLADWGQSREIIKLNSTKPITLMMCSMFSLIRKLQVFSLYIQYIQGIQGIYHVKRARCRRGLRRLTNLLGSESDMKPKNQDLSLATPAIDLNTQAHNTSQKVKSIFLPQEVVRSLLQELLKGHHQRSSQLHLSNNLKSQKVMMNTAIINLSFWKLLKGNWWLVHKSAKAQKSDPGTKLILTRSLTSTL